ncbi:hypothetical protein QBC42DRAFT_292976 [Cladorrhinum samala]|uniref:Uncharacterized protein n=1 Tax=Cladorrhinum samala TaxID=585594 RepID=A0AAV9I5J6_9PEZI|nr:hypothetical protein QBC42DRAFT_292976 [Cladorrhinum samala]
MIPQRLTAIRGAGLRPAVRFTQLRLSSSHTPQPSHVGDKGTAKTYNKDGTNPNKNFVYLGAAVVGLGGAYFMFGGRRSNSKVPGADKAA